MPAPRWHWPIKSTIFCFSNWTARGDYKTSSDPAFEIGFLWITNQMVLVQKAVHVVAKLLRLVTGVL